MDYILEHRKTCFPACLFLPEAPDVVIAFTDTDNQENSLVTAFDVLLENANQSCLAKHGPNASEAAMLDSNGLTDVDMLLCGSLLILIHILFVSHKNDNSVSAAKNTLHETLVVLNSEYTTHQLSQPLQPSHGTAQLAMAVVHQSMVFVRTYMTRVPQLAGVHLDMLMHVRPLTDQGQAVADEVVKQGVPSSTAIFVMRSILAVRQCCTCLCIWTQFI